MISTLEDRCDDLRDPGFLNLSVSILILVGLLISYLPQHYRIISRGTSEGISPYFVLLGTTSATSGFANILLLPKSQQDVACCRELEPFQCVAGLLGIAQLGVQWSCFVFILVLFLVFFRYSESTVPEEELDDNPPKWQTAIVVASVCLLHGLVLIILTAVFATVLPSKMPIWAQSLGVMAAALAAVQYLPQIWTTYHLKHVGSLSIPMMCIQTPGGLLFAGSLFARLGWAGWSSWGIFLMSAIMQGTLLAMALYFEIRPDGPAGAPGSPSQRPHLPWLHANGFDDDTPGRYENHPEQFASTPEQLARILDRQDADAADETQPLLRPGGIGHPHKMSDTDQR